MTLQDPAEKGFTTDQDELTEAAALDEHATDGLFGEPESATIVSPPPGTFDLSVLDVRPAPGQPRDYHFPRFERHVLGNGLTVVHAHVPGRALLAAQLLLAGGAWTEAADEAGVTVLAARAMPEGTRTRNATDFVDAAERLGAEIHADATWEALSASMEVPRSRFADALALLAEMVAEPAFPAEEVERLRDERLNDLLQAWADPRRRAERVFPETIFPGDWPYSRPLGGVQRSVRQLDRDAVADRHRAMVDPRRATLVVAGDLTGVPLVELAERHFAALESSSADTGAADVSLPAAQRGRVVLVDRPGAPQSEIRIGHTGVPRRTPDFHAIAVLNAILGGTFNSRLNRVIREELGYTYGISSAFEMRTRPGPFVIRTAVETNVTAPAILETLTIVRNFLDSEVQPDELNVARDYLVGVFPLRFETASQVASALAGLVVFGLPDDELDRYRPQVGAVSASDVHAAANRHIRPDELSIVVVGDGVQVEPALRDADLGELTVVPADASPG